MSDGKKPEIVLPIDIAVEWVPLTASPEEMAFLESTRYETGDPIQRCLLPQHILEAIATGSYQPLTRKNGKNGSHLEKIDDEFA